MRPIQLNRRENGNSYRKRKSILCSWNLLKKMRVSLSLVASNRKNHHHLQYLKVSFFNLILNSVELFFLQFTNLFHRRYWKLDAWPGWRFFWFGNSTWLKWWGWQIKGAPMSPSEYLQYPNMLLFSSFVHWLFMLIRNTKKVLPTFVFISYLNGKWRIQKYGTWNNLVALHGENFLAVLL